MTLRGVIPPMMVCSTFCFVAAWPASAHRDCREACGPGRVYDTAVQKLAVVIMIETPLGVANAKEIASVPGIDVIFAASTDLGNFSGYRQGDPQYEALVTTIHDVTLGAGIKLGGPLAWKDRQGFTFFQGPGETALLKSGVQTLLGTTPAQVKR